MAIKTKEEMFGDGSAGNPQVPIDLNAPPAHNALNRGVAFGEQVTSAIKNRTPYALALNDEDLDARLEDFETRGLDGAYDLGTIGPAGDGRVVTKDGGAIETVSALITAYADDIANAHYRANMDGDTLAGGVGFDAKGLTGTSGFLDRVARGFAGDTVIPIGGGAVTLNPTGTVNEVKLTGGSNKWKTGSDTNLALYFDLVEIVGSAGTDGLYAIASFTANDTAKVVRLDGAPPTFGGSDTATATLYRVRFASAGIQPLSTNGAIFVGEPGDNYAAVFMAGRSDILDSASGALHAWATVYRDTAGVATATLRADGFGRLRQDVASSLLPVEEQQDLGLYGMFVDKLNSGVPEAGFIYRGAEANESFAFMSMVPLVNTTPAFPESVTFDFTANTDELDFSGVGGGTFANRVLDQFTMFEIVSTSPSSGDEGFYFIGTKVGSGSTVATILDLDGMPAILAVTGTGVARFYTGTFIGQRRVTALNALSSGPTTATVGVVVNAPSVLGSDDGTALITTVPRETNTHHIRAFQGFDDTPADLEVFRLTGAGDVFTLGDVDAAGLIRATGKVKSTSGMEIVGTSGEYIYTTPRTRTRVLSAAFGQAVGPLGAMEPGWVWATEGTPPDQGSVLKSNIVAAKIGFPLSVLLPPSSTVTRIRALVKPAAIRAADGMRAYYFTSNASFSGISHTLTGPLSNDDDDGTTNIQILDTGVISYGIGLKTGPNLMYEIRAGTPTIGDIVYAIEVTYTDLGPQNI